MNNFKQNVIAYISAVPKGKVVSYGQVAAASGSPRAARQVGGILRALPAESKVPWWRVVNRDGYLSIKGNWEATQELQKQLLKKENVEVSSGFVVDMKKYQNAP